MLGLLKQHARLSHDGDIVFVDAMITIKHILASVGRVLVAREVTALKKHIRLTYPGVQMLSFAALTAVLVAHDLYAVLRIVNCHYAVSTMHTPSYPRTQLQSSCVVVQYLKPAKHCVSLSR